MRIRAIFGGALLGCSIFGLAAAAPIERSVSPSGQLVSYGGDAAWVGAGCGVGEGTKANLLGGLQRREQSAAPIVVNLQSAAANLPEIPATALRFSQAGSGLKLQLDLTISRKMDFGAMERELLRAILLEMIYRNQPGIASGATYVEPPNWLIEGLLALAPNRDSTALTNALAVPERITPLDEAFWERPELLDSAGRLLYRAYSFALVQLLIESADGHAHLGRYIDNLSFTSNDPLADLEAAFPQLAGNDEKIWKSKIADIRTSGRADLLTFSQTEEKLASLLQTKFMRTDGLDKSLSFEYLCQTKPTPSQRLAFQKLSQELLMLAAQANPALRSVVQHYHQVATQLALGKIRRLASRLADLKTLRARLSARMTEIDDYLNWFEATQLSTRSGLFEDCLNTSSLETPSRAHRKDSFSAYLDAMEAEF